MANTLTKLGFWQKTHARLTRHKVRSALCLLILVVLLYLAGSWAVLQIQIHFERARFMAAQSKLEKVSADITKSDIGKAQLERYCFYSSSTNEFYRGDRYCTVRVFVNVKVGSKQDGAHTAEQIGEILRAQGLALAASKSNPSPYTLISKTFDNEGVACTYDAEYYDPTVSTYSRAEKAEKSGSVVLADILCSNLTKAEYFPVTQD